MLASSSTTLGRGPSALQTGKNSQIVMRSKNVKICQGDILLFIYGLISNIFIFATLSIETTQNKKLTMMSATCVHVSFCFEFSSPQAVRATFEQNNVTLLFDGRFIVWTCW